MECLRSDVQPECDHGWLGNDSASDLDDPVKQATAKESRVPHRVHRP